MVLDVHDPRIEQLARVPASPAHLAILATEGQARPWKPYRWLRLLNKKLVDMANRRSRFLIVEAPIRHGKSELGSVWFPAWWLGRFPDDRVILTGHTSGLPETFSKRVRDIVKYHGHMFDPSISISPSSAAKDAWDLALPHTGGMVACGTGNPPTGRGGNLIVVDDPVKAVEEAYSPTYQQKLWEHWQFNVRGRLEPNGVCVIIMSRWSEEDLIGKLLKRQREADEKRLHYPDAIPVESQDIGEVVDRWEVLHLPGLAEPTRERPDPLGRKRGQALCPARYPRQALIDLRDSPMGIGPIAFQAQIQNNPSKAEGELFKSDKWQFLDALPAGLKWVRWWDLAASTKERASDDPDWTAGVLMARDAAGYVIIADIVRYQAEAPEIKATMRAVAEADLTWVKGSYKVGLSQDPGQAGKALVSDYRRTAFAGFSLVSASESGDKVVRAQPLAGQQQAGNVSLVRGPWVHDWLEEARLFSSPNVHDDQVDAASMAYQYLAGLLRTKVSLIA